MVISSGESIGHDPRDLVFSADDRTVQIATPTTGFAFDGTLDAHAIEHSNDSGDGRNVNLKAALNIFGRERDGDPQRMSMISASSSPRCRVGAIGFSLSGFAFLFYVM